MPEQNIHSLTLVLPREDGQSLAALIETIGKIPQLSIAEEVVLAQDKAVDLLIESNTRADFKNSIESQLGITGIRADFCLQKPENRRKNLLICDMDSTLIGQECIDELADYAGVKEYVSNITERAMHGELNFEQALTKRVALLKGLPLERLQECFDERIRLNTGAVTLAKTMKKNGAETLIVSGGFTFFTNRVASLAGFANQQANILLDDGEALTGEVAKPILGRDAKKQALENFSADMGGPEMALAIGDGANDLAMIQAAGLGIAYRAKPVVAAAAHCTIQHTDLTSPLYFQGFKQSEFA